jgi:hypothetical protein
MSVEYTKVMTDTIVTRYVAAVVAGDNYEARTELVKELADEMTVVAKADVSEGSVRSKLVSEKVYVGKVKAKTAETDSRSKDEYVKALRAVTGLALKSVDKATKADVKAIFDWVVEASASSHAEKGVDEVEELQAQAVA